MDEPTGRPLSDYSDAELIEAAMGCSELTCPYHGIFNMELFGRIRTLPDGEIHAGDHRPRFWQRAGNYEVRICHLCHMVVASRRVEQCCDNCTMSAPSREEAREQGAIACCPECTHGKRETA